MKDIVADVGVGHCLRMPGVGRVTVSLRRSMSASGMVGVSWGISSLAGGKTCSLRGFAPIFQIPTVAAVVEVKAAILDVLEANAVRLFFGGPLAFFQEPLKEFQCGGVHFARVSSICGSILPA